MTEPDHADDATVDIDHHDVVFHQHRVEEWAQLRQCPVVFNTHHDGFWMVSGYDEVAEVARDNATFTSRYPSVEGDDIACVGITGIPRAPHLPQIGIAEVEGPVHLSLRRTMNPFMVPKAVEAMRPLMARVATWFLDERIEAGEMDLVADFASPVPAVITMALVGLPLDGWQHYAELFHASVAYDGSSPSLRKVLARVPQMLDELGAVAEDRRREPRDDLLTALVQLEFDDGQCLDDDQIKAVLWNLVGGGLDTTTSLTSLSLHHLEAHPVQRRALIDHPEWFGRATEEFLRYFSVNETLTRTVDRDTELGGVALRRGDPVLLSWLSANRDDTVFDRPDEVVIDRERNPHLAFGVGPHRCIGMHIARVLFEVLIHEVLDRIPDYVVDRDATTFYANNPSLNGVVRMPITFTPGPRLGPPERPF